MSCRVGAGKTRLTAMLVFKVRVEGSWPGFLAVCISFCLLNATFGLMLATLGRSALLR